MLQILVLCSLKLPYTMAMLKLPIQLLIFVVAVDPHVDEGKRAQSEDSWLGRMVTP